MSIIIRLTGGLGNQLFQYALAKKLEIEKREKVLLDTSSYWKDTKRKYALDSYDISLDLCSVRQQMVNNAIYKIENKIGKFSKWITIEKGEFLFDNCLHELNHGYLVGGWQNVKYFEDIKCELINDLTYNGSYNKELLELRSRIIQEQSVAIHVRRGDYLQKGFSDIYVTQSIDYYINAVEMIRKKIPDAVFFVFSDDVAWCKQELDGLCESIYPSELCNDDAVIEFELMRLCKHHIISNSTYSWWASWLSEECLDEIRIAPSRWFTNDIDNARCRSALLGTYCML